MQKKKQHNPIISLNNMDIIEKSHIIIKVNPKIYSLDTVQSAAYVLMDKAFAIIDVDPENELVVELKPRNNKEDLEKLGRDFNNELINYAVYKIQSKRTMPIREKIIQRALLTNLKLDSTVTTKEKSDVNIVQGSKLEPETCECEQKQDNTDFLATSPPV